MSDPALDAPTPSTPAPDSESDVARVADRLRAFVAANGGSGTAVINYLGRRGARIVVVAANGPFADAVVADIEIAARICAVAELPVQDWGRELSAAVSISSADRRRMAGTGR